MFIRIAAITLIFVLTSIAWVILGATIDYRTHDSDTRLTPGVGSTWGMPHEQRPPSASYEKPQLVRVETQENSKTVVRMETRNVPVAIPLERSRAHVNLALDYRQKGLLWFSTYTVDFDSRYSFQNPTGEPQKITFRLFFPAAKAVYDGFVMELDGRPIPFRSDKEGASLEASLHPGAAATLHVAYRSQGLESWRYKPGDDVTESRDFELAMTTNFKQIDFPPDTLSPTEKRETPHGWDLVWRYRNLISGFQIGMTMPEKLQPGPLAGRISYFAPVSLLLFFFVMFMLTTIRGLELHPMNYFFLAGAFFAFHLLLAYLVDHISIHAAFVVAAAVSVFLVVSYLRLVVGPRFAAVEACGAQFLYLVLFSYAFFFQGFTGLTVTIGCVITLFVAMQLTARIPWRERFGH